MAGRDPGEHDRAATPLELLYDLTFVVAFSLAGGQLAHSLAAGHPVQGVIAFAFAVAAIVWAWINFSWFASAYDTDDWAMRLATLVQMVGVLVVGLGLADLFHGVEEGVLHNEIMVVGYVVMRVSQVALWLRAARQDPDRAPTLRRYAWSIGLAQVLWVVVAFAHLPTPAAVGLGIATFAFEFWSVYATERRGGTPWHPHHIAERYGLLAIISLGEVILGTTTAIGAVVEHQGWSLEAVLVAVAGVSLAVGLWWVYFGVPFAEVLAARTTQVSFGFGYGHVLLYASIAAVGAGLHVAAYRIEGEAQLGETGVMLTMAVPLALFLVVFFALLHHMAPGRERFHWVLAAVSLAVIALSVVAPGLGTSLGVGIVLLMLVPWVVVIGYEWRGHRHLEARLAQM